LSSPAIILIHKAVWNRSSLTKTIRLGNYWLVEVLDVAINGAVTHKSSHSFFFVFGKIVRGLHRVVPDLRKIICLIPRA